MSDWFRPVFNRTRSQPAPQHNRQSRYINDEDEELAPRLQSKASSCLNPPLNQTPLHPPNPFAKVRKEDVVYQSRFEADEHAEALKVLLMSQSTFEPVPVLYNSCMLQVLEGYQVLRSQVIAKDRQIQLMKEEHAKEVEELRQHITSLEQGEADVADGGSNKNSESRLNCSDGGHKQGNTMNTCIVEDNGSIGSCRVCSFNIQIC